jgi:hypothetical protein
VTEQTIRRLFPNASKSLISANCPELPLEGEWSRKDAPVCSELERTSGDGALGARQAEKRDSTRYFVRITSVRRRLLDEDNLSSKYVTDFCRYSGIIPQDSPGKTSIKTTQRKAGKEEAEHTLIEIFALDSPSTAAAPEAD